MNTIRLFSLRHIVLGTWPFLFLVLANSAAAQSMNITMEFTPDCWGSETSWSFDEDGGSNIASAPLGTYADATPSGTGMQVYTFSVSEGSCYTLTINDTFGDGIMGTQWTGCTIDGSFNFKDVSGFTFASLADPDFGTSTTISFCASFGCADPAATNYDVNATIGDGSCTYPELTASYSTDVLDEGCGFRVMQFTNTTVTPGTVQWSFPGGSPSSSTEENPVVVFETGSSYNIQLTVQNGAQSSTAQETIQVGLNDESEPYVLVVEPDCWGSEFGWNILDENGNVLYYAEIGDYGDMLPSNSVYTRDICLPSGCYTIELLDSYGDGFEGSAYNNCNTDGRFEIQDRDGNIKYSYTGPADYGTYTSVSWCNTSEYVWTGAFSNSWTNTGNWMGNAVPNSSSANVRIASTNYDPLLTSTYSVKNIVVDENATIDFANSNGRLYVYGNFINKGNFSATDGRVDFRGNKTQTIKGESAPVFYELRMSTNDTVHLISPIDVRGFITLTSGYLNLDGKQLTLVSDAEYTGMITKVNTGSGIVGETIKMQRYFPAASGSWRMVCSPVVGATFQQWNDDIPTTGFPGSDYPNYGGAANPWSNIRKYVESVAGNMNLGFESIASVDETIDPKKGYFTYFAPAPTLLDVEGDFSKGTLNLNVGFTSGGNSADRGWNLVANPYPCTINWTQSSGWSKTRISNTIYAYDPINGQYSTYVNGVSVGNLTNLIGPFQAFWVKTTNSNPSLTINENAKTSVNGVFMREEDMNLNALIRIQLQTTQEDVYDETVLGFHSFASTGYDEDLEAYKLFSPNPALPSLALMPDSSEADAMSIAMLPMPEEDLVVDLLVRKGEYASFTLKNTMIDTFDSSICLVLEDRELEVFVPFNLNDEYAFEQSPESEENRFALHFSAPVDVSVFNENCPEAEDGRIVVQGYGDAPWTFVWENEMGEVIRTAEDMTTADSMEDLSPGFYAVTVSNNNTMCSSMTKVVQVEAAPVYEFNYAQTAASCSGDPDGSISLTPSQGYDWNVTITTSSNEVFELELQSDTTLYGLDGGLYTIAATSSCNYTYVFNDINLESPNAVDAQFSVSSPIVLLSNGGVAYFSNQSNNAQYYEWDFGDGTTDEMSVNPQHSYTAAGDYVVRLVAYNDYCASEFETIVHVTGNSTESGVAAAITDQETARKINAHISDTELYFTPKNMIEEQCNFKVFNLNGQIVLDQKYESLGLNEHVVDLSKLSTGKYTAIISTEGEILLTYDFIVK
ncbi:MAG: hypothetical protein RL226_1291 [Bacteroidota bacterium]